MISYLGMNSKTGISRWWPDWVSLGLIFSSGLVVINALFGRFPIYFVVPIRPILTIPVSAFLEVSFWIALFLLAGFGIEVLRFLSRGSPAWHRGGQVAVLLILEAFLASVLFDVIMRRGLFRFFAPPVPRDGLFVLAAVPVAALAAVLVVFAYRRRPPAARAADGRRLGLLALVFSAVYALVFNRSMASTRLALPLSPSPELIHPHLAGLAAVALGASLLGWVARRKRWTLYRLAGLALLTAAAAAVALTVYYGLPSREERPNVIVSLWDAARSSRMSVYGYGVPTTPFLDELGSRSLVFERAYSPANYTLPSHASLFLGKSFRAHGYHLGDGADVLRYREEITLPDRLRAAGYHPVLFTENPWVLAVDKGFSEVRFFEKPALYADLRPGGGCEIGTRVSPRRYPQAFPGRMILDWMNYWRDGFYGYTLDRIQLRAAAELFLRSPRTGPVYLFWNLMNVHDRYHPYGSWRYDQLVEDYDFAGEYDLALTYADKRFRDLYLLTDLLGQLPRTIFVVTSDHGEFLGEYNLVGHHKGLFEPVIRVPLIFIHPEIAAGRSDEPAALERLFHLTEAVAAGSGGIESEIREEILAPAGAAVSEHGFLEGEGSEEFRWSRAVIDRDWHFVDDPDLGRHGSSWPPDQEEFLFPVAADPSSEEELSAQHPEAVETMRETYQRYLDALSSAREERRTGLGDDLERQLRSIGYLR